MSSTHPAGAVTQLAGGGIRQAGDFNGYDLNSSPEGEVTDEQVGDVSADVLRIIRGTVTDTSNEFKSDRTDLGSE